MTAFLDLRVLLAIAFLCAVTWGSVERVRGNNARTELAQVKLAAEKSRADAEAKQREIEARRTQDVQEVANNAQSEINTLQADLAASRSAADGLRNAAASAARRTCPRATSPSPVTAQSGSDPIDLFVWVLARHSAELEELGKFADQLRIAGVACERSYSALTVNP